MGKKLINAALFSLFHHDIDFKDDHIFFNTMDLYEKTTRAHNLTIEDVADSIYGIITDHIENFGDSQISLTLTGGMDSRVILACLLKAGVKPNCLTFGNPGAGDIFFAKKLAREFGLDFHNAVQNDPTKDWYYHWVVNTIKRDNGNAHLHRAHRTAAIAEHAEQFSPKVLFTGHMGGEGLRGLGYNNYFASSFFESVNEGRESPGDAAGKVLEAYFIEKEKIPGIDEILKMVADLSWMQHSREINKLFFLYDLVGKIHHSQDIRLYRSYVPKVVPVYLQKRYLDVLFESSCHFLAKKQGVMGRLSNPHVHCRLIELLYPKLLDYPLSNGYAPKEYLKGLWYYVPVKTIRSFMQKKQYAPTFSYGPWYVDFVNEHAQNIDDDIWQIYDRNKYMVNLKTGDHKSDEGYWHKFSNPIFFDLVEKYKKGRLTV